MAKQYSTNGFLQSIDDYSYVEQYFRNRSINDFSYTKNTDKKAKKQNDEQAIKNITDIIAKKDEDTQQEIERDFSDINKLSDDKGIDNLLNEAKDQNVNPPVDALVQNGHDVSFWFFNNHKKVFDEASAVQEFLTSGWKRVPVPSKSVDIVEKSKDALADALRAYYQKKDAGLGKGCLIDVYQKKDRVYVVAYVSARGVNDVIPDENNDKKLKKSTRRESIEIYYLYLQGDEKDGGELEIKTKGGFTTQKELLEDTKQKYDLDLLKDKNFALNYDTEDEVEGWWLKGLDLRTPDGQTKISITIKDESRVGSETMWQKLNDLLLANKMSSLRLNRADMKIKFKPTKKHPKGTKTFYITWKDTSSLNDIDDLDIKAGKVLKKSKIDCGFSN
jgi:hypothetical protein